VETAYYRGAVHAAFVPATVTAVRADATYALLLGDGDVEAEVHQRHVRSREYDRTQSRAAPSARREAMPALAHKATW
jgi:hypothetical protein